MEKNKIQMSESMMVGVLLAVAGGFLDAYTYITRGGVFANAQTGNMVLFGIHFAQGEWGKVLDYFIPILAFFLGIIIAEGIKGKYKEESRIHWRQIVIAIECGVLCVVAFLPETRNMVANALVSFVCSLQVESFRKLKGSPYATTMCTGNLRSATENLYRYQETKDKEHLRKSGRYFLIIATFIVGAAIGVYFTNRNGIKAVFVAVAVLGVTALLMSPRHQR